MHYKSKANRAGVQYNLGGVFGVRPNSVDFHKRSNLRSVKSIVFMQGKNYLIFVQFFLKLLEQALRCIMHDIKQLSNLFNNFFFLKSARTPNVTDPNILFCRIRAFQKRNIQPNTPPTQLGGKESKLRYFYTHYIIDVRF